MGGAVFKLGFVEVFASNKQIKIVGTDILGGPTPFGPKFLSGQ